MVRANGRLINWRLVRVALFLVVMINAFNLGRMSVEFSGSGSDWRVLILSIVVLITSLIGLVAAELVRDTPKGN
jgi:hypothetical protein